MDMTEFSANLVRVLIFAAYLALVGRLDAQQLSSCKWSPKPNQPEVFFVNMDKSVDRRESIEGHLKQVGIPFRRVKGLTLNDIYMPKDIGGNWDKLESMIQTNEVFPKRGTAGHPHLEGYTHVMAGLVGRARKNKLKEIGCTSSHLDAMRLAVYHNRTSSRYAIITEDDIQIPFNVDFEALAASAPAGFGILQLFNSNEESMANLWRRWEKEGLLWVEGHLPKQAASFWSTCAYLIDREVMRPILDQIAYEQDGWVMLKVVAGIKQPCRPKLTSCCIYQNESMSFHFTGIPPCVWAAKGFQADSFLYALTRTFVLSVPLITNGAGGNQSTFHQDHVESIHQSAFARQREYINQMISGKVKMPAFVSAACSSAVTTQMTLTLAKKCNYRDQTKNGSSTAVHWINRDAHYQHRDAMNAYLTDTVFLQHRRVTAVNSSDLFLPADVARTWETRWCTYHSDSITLKDKKFHVAEVIPMNNQRTILVSGLCGRGRGSNTLEDLATTVSHLLGIYQAVYHNPTTSRYALVVEDDTLMPFDIDYEALAASAPAGFGMLRLVTGSEFLLERQWNRYQRNHSDLWSTQQSDKYYDSWSTKAYMVDREVMRPALDAVLNDVVVSTAQYSYRAMKEAKIIAGLTAPCTPAHCCGGNETFSEQLPCIVSKTGFQAERFLFKIAPTYVLNIPLFTGLLSGLHSQLRGEPSGVDKAYQLTAAKHRQYMDEFIKDLVPLPPFVKVGCNIPLSTGK